MKSRSSSTYKLVPIKNTTKLPRLQRKLSETKQPLFNTPIKPLFNKSYSPMKFKSYSNTMKDGFYLKQLPVKLSRIISKQKEETNQNQITAEAYGIYDQNLTLIIGFNQNEKRMIASLTKMMTLFAAIKLINKFKIMKSETYFRISTNAANIQGTIADLEPKQWITVQDLLYALMLPSGNDAALVIAQNLGAYIYYEKKGQKEALLCIRTLDITRDSFSSKFYIELFIKYMNDLAKKIGMNESQFSNSHGLDEENHYSTIHDLGILAYEMYQDPACLIYMKQEKYLGKLQMSPMKSAEKRQIVWNNTHKLISKRQYLAGKTGQTVGAGNCLSSIIQLEGKIYFIIVLGSRNRQERFRDTQKLFKQLHHLPSDNKNTKIDKT